MKSRHSQPSPIATESNDPLAKAPRRRGATFERREPLVRIPGLFRSFEIDSVVMPGVEFLVEHAGQGPNHEDVYAVYTSMTHGDSRPSIRTLQVGAPRPRKT